MITLNNQNRPGASRRAGTAVWIGAAFIAAAMPALGGACAPKHRTVTSARESLYGALTIAVAPALNYSGKSEVDSHAAADLMASELTTVEGVAVIPVARVIALLAAQGRTSVESPEHALALAQQAGADAILVFSINEYEPYTPPIMGLAAQLYGVRPDLTVTGFAPEWDRRRGQSATGDSGAGVVESMREAPCDAAAAGPFAQSQRVYDGSRDAVVEAVRHFARDRGYGAGPLGWKRVLASQQLFLRFCCHRTVEELLTRAQPGAEPPPRQWQLGAALRKWLSRPREERMQ
ncbi:MAG TPA: hypothetical protein VGM03_22435 [Phycisphaerae bacterium]